MALLLVDPLPVKILGSDQVDKIDKIIVPYVAFVEAAHSPHGMPEKRLSFVWWSLVTLGDGRPSVAKMLEPDPFSPLDKSQASRSRRPATFRRD